MAEKIPSDRELKNKKIKESIKETKARHASMNLSVVELKLDLKCLNKTERSKLSGYFIESKWLRNYLLGLSDGEAEKHESRSREIYSRKSMSRGAVRYIPSIRIGTGFPGH